MTGAASGKVSPVSFALFLVIWNRVQNLTTPAVHLRIADWLENAWRGDRTRLLLMAFRACGKSTLVGLFCAWLLYTRPCLRLMVLAADDILAVRMVRNVRRIIERHPLTHNLRPANADQWAADRFTVARNIELREPSMLARGISSNITGSRADVFICDDVEVPNTTSNAERRAELRERLSEIPFVLTPGGTQVYIGTPHSHETLYDTGANGYLSGFDAMKVPLLDEAGTSAWPERFTQKDIERIRQASGPARFASQMMLVPTAITNARLNPDLLHFYDAGIEYREAQGKTILSINGVQMVSASCWWDPSFGRIKGDASVIAAVFTDTQGHYWLHRLQYITAASDDAATEQCRAVAQLAASLYLPSVTVEANGIGRFLPGILRRVLAQESLRVAVVEQINSRPKALRILEAFDATLAARSLHVHASIRQTALLDEMREWTPTSTNARDDGLDAVAGALMQAPVRLPHSYTAAKAPSWTGGHASHTARTDFDV